MYKHSPMKTRIQKWGNSLGVRIPKALAQEISIDSDSIVDVSSREGKIIITPSRQKSLSLRQLLLRVNEENLHDEITSGGPAGKEIW